MMSNHIGLMTFVALLTPMCTLALNIPCAAWRPKTVRLPFPGDQIRVLQRYTFDEGPCGDYPKELSGGLGVLDPKTGRIVTDRHVYVSNIDAVSGPNALLFDYGDDPEFSKDGFQGFTFPFREGLTNGWCYVAFDFKIEQGMIGLEMRGHCAGYTESKPTDPVRGDGVCFSATIGDRFTMQFPNCSGGGQVGPVEKGKWYRLNMWMATQYGCQEGVQFGGWLRLDRLLLDGQVVKGEPTRYGAYHLFMRGPWTWISFLGRGRNRYLIDNFVYGTL